MIVQFTSAEIHVWLTSCEAISDERLLVSYRELLNATEKEEESRFYLARDRHRYLVTRALVRTVLSRYATVDPKDWVFATNAYGRPYITNTQTDDDSLTFNVSHTQGLIVLGVAKRRSLGVDVENFARRDISMDLANHYFSRDEVAALHEVAHHQQRFRFFEYWTLKESYIKARGQGFSLPLDTFSFRFADDHVHLMINPELGDDSSRWQFWRLQPSSEHLLAVCAEKFSAQPPRLVLRETTPGVSERIIAPELFCPDSLGLTLQGDSLKKTSRVEQSSRSSGS